MCGFKTYQAEERRGSNVSRGEAIRTWSRETLGVRRKSRGLTASFDGNNEAGKLCRQPAQPRTIILKDEREKLEAIAPVRSLRCKRCSIECHLRELGTLQVRLAGSGIKQASLGRW